MNQLEKITEEKRKRNQIYMTLDYFLSLLSYFDFFSFESFEIAKNSKYLAQVCEKKKVTSEFLLLAFFYSSTKIISTLNEFNIDEKIVQDLIVKDINFSNYIEGTFQNKVKKMSEFFSPSTFFVNKIKYANEVNFIFEKAAENALTRFKTPIISTEILFITLFEEKKYLASKILSKLVKNETQWYLLRYKLIKNLHLKESSIREDIPSNHHYFAYLLRTQLSDTQFESLLKKENLLEGVLLFRNTLVAEILKVNLFDEIYKDINKSIKITNRRNYSS